MHEGPNKYASDAIRIGMAAECNPQLAKVAAEKGRLQENSPTLPPPFAGATLEEKVDRLRTVGLALQKRVQKLELRQGHQEERLRTLEQAFLGHRHSGAEAVPVIPASSTVSSYTPAKVMFPEKEFSPLD